MKEAKVFYCNVHKRAVTCSGDLAKCGGQCSKYSKMENIMTSLAVVENNQVLDTEDTLQNEEHESGGGAIAANGESYCSIIITQGEKYRSLQEMRKMLMADMKRRGVSFKDIDKYLLNQFQKDGYYGDEQSLKDAKEHDESWYHNLQLFLGWVDRNYEEYESQKKRAPKRKDEMDAKANEKKTKVRVATVTPKRATELIANPEALATLLASLESAGYIAGSVASAISQLEEKGYQVTQG